MLILKSSRITDNIKVTPSFYAALFVAVAVGAGFLLMPPFSDDLVYMMPFRDYIRHGNGDWFGLVRATISAHYIYESAVGQHGDGYSGSSAEMAAGSVVYGCRIRCSVRRHTVMQNTE